MACADNCVLSDKGLRRSAYWSFSSVVCWIVNLTFWIKEKAKREGAHILVTPDLLVKGLRTGLPHVCYFGMWIIWYWTQSRPCGLTKNFYLSLKGFNLGPLSIISFITRNNFLFPICRVGQTSNYWTSVLLIILQMTFLPSEAQRRLTLSLPQNTIHPSFSLSVPEPFLYVGFLYICM